MINLGNVFILGDSYSTFQGYNPNENNYWYYKGGHDRTDVSEVEQTWWSQLFSKINGNLIMNESFSGATVCNTERPSIPHTSFIYRFNKNIDSGFFNNNSVDTVFVFGGTNDSWIDVPIGENKYSNLNSDDLNSALPAFCYLLSRIQEIIPNAKIYAIINCELKEEISQGYIDACEHYNVKAIKLKDLSLTEGHPNKVGMTQICNQVLENLE